MERDNERDASASGTDGWEQYAGFSVFVERQHDGAGGWQWRTRLYHDESADVVDVAGLAVGEWLPWLQGRLPRSAGDTHHVTAEVGDVRVVECRRSTTVGDLDARIEVAVTLRGAADLSYAIGAAVLGAMLADLTGAAPEPVV